MEVEYPMAVDTAEMIVAYEIGIEAHMTIIENPVDQMAIGQLIKIPVDGPEADIGYFTSDLTKNPFSSRVALGTLEHLEYGISLFAFTHDK
jgi:hypothetical protein